MAPTEFAKIADLKNDMPVVVALEKKHSDEIIITYYIQHSRKKLDFISFDTQDVMSIEKKDPYGITVTEVYHITKMMDQSYLLTAQNINTIKKLLQQRTT